jgi:hypothetical protein
MADGTNMKRLYVVGDKETGVAFITLAPLRAALVSSDEIRAFARSKGKDVDQVFGDIAQAVQAMILKSDGKDRPDADPIVSDALGALIQGGATISDAEFCFVANLVDTEWQIARNPFPPIEDSLDHLAEGIPGYETTAYPAGLRYGSQKGMVAASKAKRSTKRSKKS